MNREILIVVSVILLFYVIESKDSKESSSSSSSSSSEEDGDNNKPEGFKIDGVSNETMKIIHDSNLTKEEKLDKLNFTLDQNSNETDREQALAKFDKAIELDGFAQNYLQGKHVKNVTDNLQQLVESDAFQTMTEEEQREAIDRETANLNQEDLEEIEQFEEQVQGKAVELGLHERQNETVLGVDTFGAQGI